MNAVFKGFTLVELMITVVLIGILAAIAIPSLQKTARNTVKATMENDAGLIGRAAQQYWLENPGGTSVDFRVNPLTGVIDNSSPLADYVKTISKGMNTEGPLVLGGTFTMSHVQLNGGTPVVFNDEGKRE